MSLNINDLIYTLTHQSLGNIPFHQDSHAVKRFTAQDFPFHVAVHKVDAGENKANPTYVEEHSHEYTEINIVLSENSELVYDFTLDGQQQIITSPGIVYIPANTKHTANVVRGSGTYICIILADTSTVFGELEDNTPKEEQQVEKIAQASETMSAAKKMKTLISGNWMTQMIYVAAKLGISDQLQDGPLSITKLAQKVQADPEALFRLLRALASQGIYQQNAAGQFELTELAETLLSDGDDRVGYIAIRAAEEDIYRCWGQLLDSVKTGKTAFDHLFGMPYFDYLFNHASPEKAENFDNAMPQIHYGEVAAMLEAYDFSRFSVIADIGCGVGTVLCAVLEHHPTVHGIFYDFETVIARTNTNIQALNLQSRAQTQGGSFFDTIPTGAQAYILRHILHDWSDDDCQRILAKLHASMEVGSTLLIMEAVIPQGNAPFFAKLLDLQMMLVHGGKERTLEGFRTLLSGSGFKLTNVVPASAGLSIIEAVRV